MADDFDRMFEEFEKLADTSRSVMGLRTVTAYDDIKHPSLSDEGDGVLPPEEPSEDEVKSFIRELPVAHAQAFRTYVQEEPAARDFSRLLDDYDVAVEPKSRVVPPPAAKKEENPYLLENDDFTSLDQIEAEADAILQDKLDRKYLAPEPKPGYYLHKPVDEVEKLYTIYRTFRAMFGYDLPLVSIRVDGELLTFSAEGNTLRLTNSDRALVYEHEDTGFREDVLVWVSNQNGRIGYIFNGWTYRRKT